MSRTIPLTLVAIGMLTLVLAEPVRAQTYRMETDVKIAGRTNIECQTLTLFTDGLVYDFVTTFPAGNPVKGQLTEVVVFNLSSGRVVLLDVNRCVKTVLTTDQILQLTAMIKAQVPPDNPVFKFAADPKFTVKFLELENELTLSADTMTYRVKGVKPDKAGAATSYQEFADWSARLNACRPGNLPPFARMEVSKQLAERGLIPDEIHRTIVAPGKLGNRKLEVTSKHLVNWGLSTRDQKRIDDVGDQITKFQSVSFHEFTNPDKLAGKK